MSKRFGLLCNKPIKKFNIQDSNPLLLHNLQQHTFTPYHLILQNIRCNGTSPQILRANLFVALRWTTAT